MKVVLWKYKGLNNDKKIEKDTYDVQYLRNEDIFRKNGDTKS